MNLRACVQIATTKTVAMMNKTYFIWAIHLNKI